jgi:L-malate glycosyltransferase
VTRPAGAGPADRLRLAFLADANSIHSRRWISWFARAGHEVTLVDPFSADISPGLEHAIRVVRDEEGAGRGPLGGLRRARWLRGVVKRLGSPVLHAHFVRRYGWLGALSGVRPRIVSPWGSDILSVPSSQVRTRLLNRFALRSADLVTVSSDGMRDAAIRSGALPGRVELVLHGVDTERFAPGPPSGDAGASVDAGEAPVVLSPRSIRPLYRQELIVDAVAALSAEDGRRPILVMSARAADPAYLTEIRRRAAERGILDQLRVLDDVAHADLPDLLRLADVVVSIPRHDSFPLSILEAMACGVPVVAGDLPSITPVLGPLHPIARELIVPVSDPGALVHGIGRALGLEPGDRAALGAALRDHVVRTADYETNMRRMEALYRGLAR